MAERGFLFIRHGQTTANRDAVRSGGESEVHLTAHGRAQVGDAAVEISAMTPAPGLIVVSDLVRTRETAEILDAHLKLETRVDTALNERLLGEWNGRPNKENQHLLVAGKTPPGGESSADFETRVLTAFRGLTPLYGRWPVIVSSCGIARVLMEYAGHKGAGRLPNGVILCVTLADGNGFEIADIKRMDGLPIVQAAVGQVGVG